MALSTYTFQSQCLKMLFLTSFTLILMVQRQQVVLAQEIPLQNEEKNGMSPEESVELGPDTLFPVDAETENEIDLETFVDIDLQDFKPSENDIVVDGQVEEYDVSDPIEKKSVLPEIDPTLIKSDKDFYSHSVYDIDGKLVSLQAYRGKVTLIVNVASECGFTDSHYRALIRLHNILSVRKHFSVLAFPCNQFGAQEPGTNEDIQRFTHNNYHLNFPLFSKINVLGDEVPGAWVYIIEKSGQQPTWNFWKYLVDANGHFVKAWGPWTSVEDIFHEVKELVDHSAMSNRSGQRRRGGEL